MNDRKILLVSKVEKKGFEDLYNNVMCGIIQYSIDEELKVLNINEEALRIQGLPNKDEFKTYIQEHKKIGKRVDFEHEIIRENGQLEWVMGNVDSIIGLDGEKIFQCVFMDITEQKENENALKKRAETDDLSGLLNRATAKEIIDEKIKNLDEEKKYAFLLIDIDKFKKINDAYGHPQGDCVIKEIAKEIKAQFREDDVVARIGGDEFAAFFSTKKIEVFVSKKAASLIKKVEAIPENKNFEFPLSISVGIAISPNNGDCFDSLFEKADKAMYIAKDNGGGRFHII